MTDTSDLIELKTASTKDSNNLRYYQLLVVTTNTSELIEFKMVSAKDYNNNSEKNINRTSNSNIIGDS